MNAPQTAHRQKILKSCTLITEREHTVQWKEFKINGGNITSRSYSSIVIYDNTLYVYGGYQVSQGILSSFYQMQLNQLNYKWNEIKNKVFPGPLTKHSMFSCDKAIFLQGGQSNTNKQSNTTHRFDLTTMTWSSLPKNKTYPEPFDNHASVHYDEQVAIFGGYSMGKLENTLRIYNIQNNEWQTIHSTQNKFHSPQAREGCGLSYGNKKLYLFGGTNGQSRLNDLWSFDLVNLQWSNVHIKNDTHPNIRNGFAFDFWDGKLVLFGGIHDITWELDDLWTLNLLTNDWIQVEEDSTRRIDANNPTKISDDSFNQTFKSSKAIQEISHSNSPYRTFKSKNKISPPKFYSPNKGNENMNKTKTLPSQQTSDALESRQRHKTLDDQKKKEFEIRKTNMLQLFDVPESQVQQLRSASPTSENMRNALLLIGNPAHKQQKAGKLTDFGKVTISKFMLPLKNGSNTFFGKRPCARDGHKSTIYNNQLIIFGGDRHQMSFNDIHSLDLHSIE